MPLEAPVRKIRICRRVSVVAGEKKLFLVSDHLNEPQRHVDGALTRAYKVRGGDVAAGNADGWNTCFKSVSGPYNSGKEKIILTDRAVHVRITAITSES